MPTTTLDREQDLNLNFVERPGQPLITGEKEMIVDGNQSINVRDLLLPLSRLNELLDQQQFFDYWHNGLALLSQFLTAQGVSLRLLDPSIHLPAGLLRSGVIDGACTLYLDNWEQQLLTDDDSDELPPRLVWQDLAAESEQPTAAATKQSTGGEAPHYRVLHVRIIMEHLVQGAISFVLASDASLTDDQTADLGAAVQLFGANGLRTQSLQSTRTRLDRANLLSQISQAITSSLDLKTVFNQTTELAASILRAQAATLFSIDYKNRELLFMIAKGAAAHALEEKRLPIEQGVVGWVATHGKPLIVNNTHENKLFNSQVDSQTGFFTRNILCVPLRFQERTVGVLEVLNKENEEDFTSDDAEWLNAMGQHIAIALENAQLYENLRREQERIIKAQEEVRNQLARELHDNTAQMLSLIIMNLDLARQFLEKNKLDRLESELQRIEEYAKQANREVRTLLFELRPIILESRGLVPALHAYHRQLQSSMTTRVHLDAAPLGFEISLQGASIIFSIIQEAINNIRKHARAKNVWIRVSSDIEKLNFAVEDDGVGFDVDAVTVNYEERGSFGLLNMQERAALLAGRLQVQSPRTHGSNGTVVSGYVPLSSIIDTHDKKG